MKYGRSSFATIPAIHHLSGVPAPNGLRSASSPVRSGHFLFNRVNHMELNSSCMTGGIMLLAKKRR
eukprot:6251708-Ditylum_brightwellii.AAC.1